MLPDSAQPAGDSGPHKESVAGEQHDEQTVEAPTPECKADAESEKPEPWDAKLLPRHRDLITASAILPEIATERGYRSALKKSELRVLGFGDKQQCVPSLLIPVWTVHGEIGTYQIRPDNPRIGKDGRTIKYETPGKSRMVIDVPRRCRELGWLDDPTRALFITEGARKADAGVSQGLCTISLLGVWNWRGSNEHGGKTALPDWESIALNGREVFLAFDSDVMTKGSVYGALSRLKAFLESRKAKVKVIYLPEGAKP